MKVADYLNQFPKDTNYLTLPQHESWVKTNRSDITGTEYQYNDIELIEDLMDYFFVEWRYNIIRTDIMQDKSGVSVTIQIELIASVIQFDKYPKTFVGIASEWAPSLKSLPLITPKCASMAFKNAARKIGRLFGKDLNRFLENNDLPVVNIEKQDKKSTAANLINAINGCTTTDQLLTYQMVAKANEEAWAVYQTKLSELI
jgi:hypothetical protein